MPDNKEGVRNGKPGIWGGGGGGGGGDRGKVGKAAANIIYKNGSAFCGCGCGCGCGWDGENTAQNRNAFRQTIAIVIEPRLLESLSVCGRGRGRSGVCLHCYFHVGESVPRSGGRSVARSLSGNKKNARSTGKL